jgi:hypothetical protein
LQRMGKGRRMHGQVDTGVWEGRGCKAGLAQQLEGLKVTAALGQDCNG